MADDNDIARMKYVIDNYDNIELLNDVSGEFRDKNQNPAPLIKMSKRIDGTYYVVEAVPDTKKHQLNVVSAYKNKAVEQQMGTAQGHDPNVRNASTDTAFNNNIPQSDNVVNNQYMQGNADAQGINTIDSVIKRLNTGDEVTLDEIYSIPEIQDALQNRQNINTAEMPGREELRKNILNDLYNNTGSYQVDKDGKSTYNGIVNKNRRADIIVGPPAAGKSSVLAEPLSAIYKSRIVDSDEAKKRIPEFNNGYGAGDVHEESSIINAELFKISVRNGENIVLPTVGGSKESLLNKINMLKANGYKVYLHLNELPSNKATARAIQRFINTNRFVDPQIVYNVGDKPVQVFNELIKMEGLLDGYTHYSNDVEYGQEPIEIKSSSEDITNAIRLYRNRGQVYGQGLPRTDARTYSKTERESEINGASSDNEDAFSMQKNKVYDYAKTFAEQVDDWVSGKIPKRDTLLIGGTPDVFKKIGLNSLPFTINQTHVDYAINGTKDSDHHIGEEMLKQLPYALENPVAIFQDTRNAIVDNRLIALLKLTHNRKQVIMPVSIDGFVVLNGKEIDSNAIVSIFAKSNSVEGLLNDALSAEMYGNKSMFYWNKKEALSLLQRARVQYPRSLPQDGFIHSIRENDSFVNYRLEDVTHSKQFKKWFGKSQAVNEDGTPKVFYHSTPADFTVFKKCEKAGLSGKGIYFSPYSQKLYGQNIMAVYLKINNPMTKENEPDGARERNSAGIKTKIIPDFFEKYPEFDGIILKDEVVVKSPEQIKSATDNIGTFDGNNPDIRYSVDNSPELQEVHNKYNKLLEKYGAIKKGENPKVDVKVPKKSSDNMLVSEHARTIAESGLMPDEMQGEFEKMVVDGNMSHQVIKDKVAQADAVKRIRERGFEEAVRDWEGMSEYGRIDKKDIAFGQALLNGACANKDVELAKKLAVDLAMIETQSGQNLQAARMLKKMSPDGQLYYLEKSTRKINEELKEKFKDKDVEVEIDNDLAKELLNAKNKKQINEAVEKIQQNIADQMPATAIEKWNAWRYLSMLGNTRTHIRNIVGNAAFVPVRKIKNLIGAGLEKAILPKEERAKSFVKTDESKKYAADDWEEMKDVVMGNEGKYNNRSNIENKKQIFKLKFLEWARKTNMNALEAEDAFFLKGAYKDSFAQMMTARGYTAEFLNSGTKEANIALNELRGHAMQEAREATYRDASKVNEVKTAINP